MCFCYEPVKLVFADHLLELQVFAEKESESSQESDLLNSIFSQMLSSLFIILCYGVLIFPKHLIVTWYHYYALRAPSFDEVEETSNPVSLIWIWWTGRTFKFGLSFSWFYFRTLAVCFRIQTRPFHSFFVFYGFSPAPYRIRPVSSDLCLDLSLMKLSDQATLYCSIANQTKLSLL